MKFNLSVLSGEDQKLLAIARSFPLSKALGYKHHREISMLHKFHKISALIIGSFVLIHLINHSFILNGTQQHINFMESFRIIYRNPIAEIILLICVLFQVYSGINFLWRRRGQRSGFFEKAQAISGLYLAYFFLNHVGAVLFGRYIAELDTNIYYGIAGFYAAPFHLYFIPYYFLAVVAIFIHIASAFYWLSRNSITDPMRKKLTYSIIIIGVLISATLILGFNGAFSEIIIPPEYLELYE